MPPIRNYRNSVYSRRRELHSAALPDLHPSDRHLLDALERDAICVVPIASLGWSGTGDMLDELDRLAPKVRVKTPKAGNFIDASYAKNYVDASYNELLDYPALREWGLGRRARVLAEHYLGLPIFYDGPHVRCEMCNGSVTGVRQWHLDTEDHRVLKLILYANDVGQGGAPFEYLPLPETDRVVRQLNYKAGLVLDERLSRAGSQLAKVEAIYPRHTAIFVDAARLFHRAQLPLTADRLTATYCWFSIHGHRDHHPHGRVVRDILSSELPAFDR